MTPSLPGPSIVTLLGTSRPGSYTRMALALVEDEFRKRGVALTSVDPSGLLLPFPGEPATADAVRLRETIAGASAIVIATPEYHGSFAARLKLVIENLGFPSALSGKPVALMGVGAGRIGAVKSLEQLRGVCSHVGGLVLPLAISVANVRTAFDETGRCLDEGVEKQLRGVAATLLNYLHQHVCPRVSLEALVRGEMTLDELR